MGLHRNSIGIISTWLIFKSVVKYQIIVKYYIIKLYLDMIEAQLTDWLKVTLLVGYCPGNETLLS